MIFSALFIFAALAEMPIWAKVVSNFNECIKFFYERTEPQGLDQNAIKICQKLEYNSFSYASLYSKYHRIPVYSAYTFNGCSNQDGRKSGDWFIEPQLSGISEEKMQPERDYNRDSLKISQALNGDYSNTGYDRGHLNPNSFQCDDDRKATFTLTNSAPMDACFNRVRWKEWEKEVKAILKTSALRGTTYLVTGTVISADYKIPRKGDFDYHSTREYNRVTVPTNVWTAVCYKDNDDEERSFSFGYIGLNQPDSKMNVMTVPQLNNLLAKLYAVSKVNIFKDDCFSTKPKSEEIVKKLYKKIQLPISDRLIMPDNILNTFHTAMSRFDERGQPPTKMPRVTEFKIQETFDSMETWYKTIEKMKYVSGQTCVLSQQFTGPSTGVQKRDTSDNSEEIVCNLVPEGVSHCTTSCLFKEKAGDYYCYDGAEEKLCSPEYSIITVSGTKCNSGHTCGTHEEKKYYWCKVGNSWEYCSTPLPIGKGLGNRKGDGRYCRSNHNCGWYNKDYTWCYTDYNNNWDYCCKIGDNRYSALNNKMCKPDHPCGYHDKEYLWCYTTDETWEYCCESNDQSFPEPSHDELF